jgi:DNA-directed RNA polymerase specialized sigma24 family protein
MEAWSMESSERRGATYEDLAVTIDRVARRVAADYPDIDWEDLRQQLVVFVLENGESIKLKEDGGNPNWLLGRVAQTYSKKLRSQHMSLSPQYAYRPSDVKAILETAFDQTARGETHVPDDARNPLSNTFTVYDTDGAGSSVKERDPFAEVDAMEVASDVMAAYNRLNPEERKTIFCRYALGWIPDNASYERKKLNSAIKELTYRLNTYRGKGPYDRRMRKAKSNSGSQVAISKTYEG